MTAPVSTIASRSDHVRIRGLRYHVRRWGRPDAPMVFLGHGWLDVSATFQFLVQPLLDRWQVLAPDWRGFGHTQWPADGYWFPDYVADLDALIAHYSPDAAVQLVGHSMGAQIMSLYAGLRPERVARYVCLDGLFLPDMEAARAPKVLRRWMGLWPGDTRERYYPSFEALARRVRAKHPQLSPERALFIARCWGAADGHGRIRLLADPKHHLPMATLYRAAESKAIWQQVTARTLFIDAGASMFAQAIAPEETAARRACFRERVELRIDGAGHMLHFDAPETTGAAIAAFLGQTR
jgi:pimeloyl-ACP methyl ester carboxylesterase